MKYVLSSVILTLSLMFSGCPDVACESCIHDCEYDVEENGLYVEDCFDYCVYKEECEPSVIPGMNPMDASVEDASACWQTCPCEFENDPIEACSSCLVEKGC